MLIMLSMKARLGYALRYRNNLVTVFLFFYPKPMLVSTKLMY